MPATKKPDDDYRAAVCDGTATARMHRDELARRIRSHRAVSRENDPQRGYRMRAQECRKAGRYARIFGLGKVAKGGMT